MNESDEPQTDQKDDELSEDQLDGVSGGTARAPIKEPVPAGPVPIPYPNATTTIKQ